MANVNIAQFTGMIEKLLVTNGLNSDDAKIVIGHLLDAELAEHPSHGFLRIPKIVKDLQKYPPTKIVMEIDSPVSGLLNGGNLPGLLVAYRAAEIAIEKAEKSGISIVGAHETNGTGAIGYYVRKIAEANLIGIAMCNSEGSIPPTGGIDPIMGTNPIACGIPTSKEPIVIDLATAKMTYGDMVIALKQGKPLPEGVLLDENGNPTTDPKWADTGAFLPIAGHKGYALALMVEILAGPLVKAKAGLKAVPGSWGFVVMAIKPGILTPIDQFKSEVDLLVSEIKNSRKMKGTDEIFIPGERSNKKRQQNKDKTELELTDQIVFDIERLR